MHEHVKEFSAGEVVAHLDGSIILKAVSSQGDPVELAAHEARAIAEHLLFLCDQD